MHGDEEHIAAAQLSRVGLEASVPLPSGAPTFVIGQPCCSFSVSRDFHQPSVVERRSQIVVSFFHHFRPSPG